MTTQETIEILKHKKTDYYKTVSFSQLPGIYAFFYIGDDFPIFGDAVSKHQIIYIGKTESSQEKRDAKTHFTSGKTGSSTVRKSIGSILCGLKDLKPIPRNDIDYKKGRLSHFKFDFESEEIITGWMKKNLALSFYEYPKTKHKIEQLESAIISELVPILNISKNPKNPYKAALQKLRKSCALMAAKSINECNAVLPPKPTFRQEKTIMNTSGKYIELWSKYRNVIKEKLLLATSMQSIQLNEEEFQSVGNRKSYSFNLEYYNGVVNNNIGGSAVARDLAMVLENSDEIMSIVKTGHLKINMDSRFCLWIEKK